jgi:sugar lactone lactonase YvrE
MNTRIKESLRPWTMLTVIILLLLFLPASALSQETYVFERMWPIIQQNWYFGNPSSVAVDQGGNVYVLNRGNHSLSRYTSDGHLITKWGRYGSCGGEFNYPHGVAVDDDGNVYVADTGNHRVQRFNRDGELLGEWGGAGTGQGELLYPYGITVGTNGDVYVVDAGNYRIQRFASNGQYLDMWGSEGTGYGEFLFPCGIDVDAGGNVYVADQYADRIQKFTPDGEFLLMLGTYGTADGEFDYATGVAVDGSGNVYVIDAGNSRIQVFDSNGVFLAKWGDPGNAYGAFSFVLMLEAGEFYYGDIAVNEQGRVYVADMGNNRVQQFTSNGVFITSWGSEGFGGGEFHEPDGIALDSSDNIYVCDSKNHRIQKFSPDGQFTNTWGGYGTANGELKFPFDIAVSGTGYVYVSDQLNYRIQRFTLDGQFVDAWGTQGSGEGEFDAPMGLALDAIGNVYVADYNNHRIQKFTSEGQFIRTWGFGGTALGQMLYPNDVAIDQSGYVHITEEGNHRVQVFTSDGVSVRMWGQRGTGNGDFVIPLGLAFDALGNVYVADGENDRIQVFTSTGTFITAIGETGSDPGRFNYPAFLSIAPDGRLYVSDSDNNRIQVFAPTEPQTTINKALIIAGGGPSAEGWINNIWDATQMCANYAYRALTYQGYTKDTIYYLSSDTDLDLDGNGLLDDVDADATNSNLQYALTTWAQDADELFIYMVDHGGAGTFRMGPTELLSATDLDAWLDEIQTTIPGPVTLLYDACRSGSFLPVLVPPAGKARVLATSASSEQEAIFGSQGTISFSFLFWGHLFNGDSFYESFVHATNSIGVTYPQDPLLEGNGNDAPNEREDQEAARAVNIGNETRSAGDLPSIGSVSASQTLYEGTSALLYAAEVIDADGISRVWAVITPPGYASASPDDPVTDLPIIELGSVGNNRYEGTYTDFTSSGTYTIAIYASDRGGVISLPKATSVASDASQGDSYEEDDSFDQAHVIELNLAAQSHNFHDAGDQDWVKFYGISREIYEIKTSNLGIRCDTVIELYDTDGTTLLIGPWNWGFEGEDELMNWVCPADGVYYVRVYHYGEEVFGEDTEYDLQVYRPVGPDWKWFIGGMVANAHSGQPIAGAIITTSVYGSAISLADGSYLMLHPAGTFTFTVSATGYESITSTGVLIPEDNIDTLDFGMVSIATLYFPHIDTNSPWGTEIALINTSATQIVSGTLRAYSNTGQLIDTMGITLDPHGRRQITISSLRRTQAMSVATPSSISPASIGWQCLRYGRSTPAISISPTSPQARSGGPG